jgi:hypothetical protein
MICLVMRPIVVLMMEVMVKSLEVIAMYTKTIYKVCMQPSFPLFMLFMFVLVSYLIWLSSVAHE